MCSGNALETSSVLQTNASQLTGASLVSTRRAWACAFHVGVVFGVELHFKSSGDSLR